MYHRLEVCNDLGWHHSGRANHHQYFLQNHILHIYIVHLDRRDHLHHRRDHLHHRRDHLHHRRGLHHHHRNHNQQDYHWHRDPT